MESLSGRMRHGLRAHLRRVVSTGTLRINKQLNILKWVYYNIPMRVAPRVKEILLVPEIFIIF